ncbi:glycosyl transferase [Salisaeta longa]|uniref:glycosyl transferase n=1 Tax=Salisaeta longa TaxID=503170 RepID=UPI0003B5A2A7|nr:glycosyl transferase [Salisaeta longa]
MAALLLTPLVIWGVHRAGWIAYPKDDRWHTRPVALLGGLGIFASVGVGLWASGAWASLPVGVLLGGVVMFGTGLADDLYDIRPEAKLVAQVVATALVLWAGLAFWRGGPVWLSVPLTFLWVIGISNAVNLIDGMDGLAAGITAIAGGILGVIALWLDHASMAVLALVLAAACIGFLVYNVKPARVFMGDCGSLFLGYVLAVLAMTVQSSGGPFAATLVPIVVLAVPIFDTTFVTVTRILQGRPITEGGVDHTMHRLVHDGLSERQTVYVLYVVSLVFGVAGLAVYQSTAQLFYALLLLCGVATVVFGLYLAGTPVPGHEAVHRSATERLGAWMRAVAGGVSWKSVMGMMADLMVVMAAFILAHYLRYAGALPANVQHLVSTALPLVAVAKVAVFYMFGLYHGIWRHAGTPEVIRLFGATMAAAALTWGVVALAYGVAVLSVAVVILDLMIVTLALLGVRFGFRALRQYAASQRRRGQPVLLFGTDEAAMLALRHLRQDDATNHVVVGLIAARPSKIGLHLQGVSVVGTPASLAAAQQKSGATAVIVPVLAGTPAARRALRTACEALNLTCLTFRTTLQSTAPLPAASGDGLLVHSRFDDSSAAG